MDAPPSPPSPPSPPVAGRTHRRQLVPRPAAGVLAGALAVVFSYEDIGAAILWFLMVNVFLTFCPQSRWDGLTQVGGSWLQIAWVGLVTLVFLSYASHEVVTGRPDWISTRIIRSRQTRQPRDRQGAAA